MSPTLITLGVAAPLLFAQPTGIPQTELTNTSTILVTSQVITPPVKEETTAPVIEEPQVTTPKVEVYIVQQGDTLSSIAAKYNVTWMKLWQKNTQLANQDVLHVGDNIIIPTADEVLAERQPIGGATSTHSVSYSSSGNTYTYGNCTWYVKNRRPDLPNSLGNANTWFYNARALGIAVGYAPRPGAVGVTTAGSAGHVVYIESVNSNNTVNISEMNYYANGGGFGRVSYRTASASSFSYIY